MTNPRWGRSARVLLVTACLTLSLSSCGDGDDDGDDDESMPTPAGAATGSAEESPSIQDDSSLALEDAAAVAVKAVDGSKLLTIETEQGRTVWEATVVTRNGTEHELLISSADGELLDGPTRKLDDAEDRAENRARLRADKLGHQEAARAISDAVPDARLVELNLDTFEDRITAWEGDLHGSNGIRYSVKIDARSGDVLEKDADAEDDD